MRLFHDDVRPAPEGWSLARNNIEAKAILMAAAVEAISLDHDLGADGGDIVARGSSPQGSGLDLVRWMIAQGLVPPLVVIHSWNPVGARNMANALLDAGYQCSIQPYRV